MKIAFASDLHFEFQETRIHHLIEQVEQDTGVLVLAGDIQVCDRIILDLKYIHEELPDLHIVFVAGNHEFYGAKIFEIEESLKVAFNEHPKIHYLEKTSFELNNVLFLGTTLWSGFNAYPQYDSQLSMENAERGIGDFHEIFQGTGLFRPTHCIDLFNKNYAWLSNALEEDNDDKTTIVISHFPPHPDLFHGAIPNNSLSNYFQTDCSAIIEKYEPDYWIYGHNHWTDEKRIGKTTLISNQLGYPNEYCRTDQMLKYIIVDDALADAFENITPEKYRESLNQEIEEWIDEPPKGKEIL